MARRDGGVCRVRVEGGAPGRRGGSGQRRGDARGDSRVRVVRARGVRPAGRGGEAADADAAAHRGAGRGAPRSSSRTLGTNPPGTWVGETDLDEAEGGVNPRAWAAGVADALNADPRDTRALVLDEGAAALGPRPATSAASGCALTLHPFKSSFTSSTTTGGEPGATGASRTALSERDRGEDTIARSRRAACASRARTPTLDARSRDTICVDRWSVREEPCVSSTFDIISSEDR